MSPKSWTGRTNSDILNRGIIFSDRFFVPSPFFSKGGCSCLAGSDWDPSIPTIVHVQWVSCQHFYPNAIEGNLWTVSMAFCSFIKSISLSSGIRNTLILMLRWVTLDFGHLHLQRKQPISKKFLTWRNLCSPKGY